MIIEYLYMKPVKILPIALILSGILLSSCRVKKTGIKYDYALYPKGTVLSGEMKSGTTLHLIREETAKMAGFCLIDNNRAVAERISFDADSSGVMAFIYRNERYSGKMTVHPITNEIEITLPNMPALEAQTIILNYSGKISEQVDCTERYKDPVFNTSVAEKNIQYGTAPGYYSSKPSDYISKEDYKQWFNEMLVISKEHKGFLFKGDMRQLPLMLDVYQPDNDSVKKRPLLLFIHGGAFIFGDKENIIQKIITDELTKKGFVVASINYRLGTSITPGSIERTIYRDVQDARAALRFLVHQKEKFSIDEEQIYIAGSSAGGIISLTTAFMDSNEVYSSTGSGLFRQRENLGGLDDSGNKLKDSFKIAGIASLWGGVTNLDILNNNRIPTLLFHGTADNIVPCNEGLPFRDSMGEVIHGFLSLFGKIYGSEAINARLKSMNVPVNYISFPGAGHDPCIDPDETENEKMSVICRELGDFLYDNVSQHYFNQRLSGKAFVGQSDAAPVYKLDNPGNVTVQWYVDGGLITNQMNDSIRVIWYSSQEIGSVTACITNENGLSCKKEIKVKIRK